MHALHLLLPPPQAAQFLKTVAPRRFNGLISDKGFYSQRFKKEDAYMYMALAQAQLLCSNAQGEWWCVSCDMVLLQ